MSKGPARIPVTDDDFALFDRSVHRFAEMAGLGLWDIYTERLRLAAGSDGCCTQIYHQKKAIITISDTIHPLSKGAVHIAAHEVAELIMAQMDWMAKNSCNANEVNEHRHEAVNSIVRLFLLADASQPRHPLPDV